jgi:hypothetical protein
MHKLISAARPRTAGIAAGAVLAGGLAGGLLLASGTAYAATTNTSTAITGTTQTQTHTGHSAASIATYLSCPSSVFIGGNSKCTLYVTNKGGSYAQDVTAKITLPSQLRADNCGDFYGCQISNNTAVENLGSLNRGQTKELTVTFTAKTGSSLFGRHRGYRFNVKVVGSANSNGGFTDHGNQSSSTAYVTIVPTGRWA